MRVAAAVARNHSPRRSCLATRRCRCRPASQLLDGAPNGFASLEALAAGRAYLVLLASHEAIMADKLRQTLVAFAATLPVAPLDAPSPPSRAVRPSRSLESTRRT